MYSKDEMFGVHEYILHTPESALRKMWVNPKFTENHFRMACKIARGCPPEEFAAHWEAGTFPKVKWGNAELPLREGFWAEFGKVCVALGLVGQQKAA